MSDERDGWTVDLARLDHDLGASQCQALGLVNPHNPTGRVMTAEELDALARLARRHDQLVISDEIHLDLIYSRISASLLRACPSWPSAPSR